MGGDVAVAVPRAAAHEAPVADTLRGVVGVIEIGKAEQQVPELVRTDADPAILGNGQIGEDLRPIGARAAGRVHLCDQMSPESPVCSPPLPA